MSNTQKNIRCVLKSQYFKKSALKVLALSKFLMLFSNQSIKKLEKLAQLVKKIRIFSFFFPEKNPTIELNTNLYNS